MQKHGNDSDTVSRERRELLKAGVALAAVPVLAGVASAVLPGTARADTDMTRKKVLLVSASPRQQGNSDLLCDAFMQGARESGHHVEKIRLVDKDIAFCTGCCTCIHDPGACVQDDDMADILAKILAADVLVLASPVYFRIFNARMKNFIDRVCPIYTMVSDKDVYFLASAAGGQRSVDSIVDCFRIFTDCLYGVREKGIVAATGVWDEGRVKGTREFQQAYEMGRNA